MPVLESAVGSEASFARPSAVETRDEQAEQEEQKIRQESNEQQPNEGGASLHDVKRALRNNFRATGVIDDVTARLRRQFVLELRRKGLGVRGAQEAAVAADTCRRRRRSPSGISLQERVLHSLVVDHLASNGLLQSLAVFLPESGLGGGSSSSSSTATVGTGPGAAPAAEAALSREDVLQALPIPADSALFRRVIRRAEEGEGNNAGPAVPGTAAGADAAVVSYASAAVPAAGSGGHTGAASSGGGGGSSRQQNRICGLLEALVGEVATRSRAVAVDSNTQTDEAGRSHKENLVTRLEAVRETWLRRSADERREPAQDVTERMLAYQRECESRAAAQIKAERDSFRERDLAALRVQMASTRRREVDAMRKELQSQYDARVERLQETERNRERRHNDRMRQAEVSQFEARQNLLREMDILRTREQEIRRSAELDSRGVRAEELRLRDLAVSLEARAEEVRRREREGARGREDALQAARHEARQSLEVKEEGVAREREFLKKEMEAVRAERKACQEQLSQHAETSRALQEARSDALAQEARATAAEAEAERAAEQAAVYKEAYQMRREVTVEGDRAFVHLGRQELEGRVQSLEASMEEERARQAKSIRKATEERDALRAEATRLRERERQWEAEATELRQALSSAELDRDRAEHRAEEEECERSALDGQVEELRAALRRSRDAIEAIRLCDVEAEASSTSAAAAATAAAAAVAASTAAAAAERDAVQTDPAGHHLHGSTHFGAGWTASSGQEHHRRVRGGDDGRRRDGSWGQPGGAVAGGAPGVGEFEQAPVFFRRRGSGGDRAWSPAGGAVREYHERGRLDGDSGEWVTQAVSSAHEDGERRPGRRRGGGSRGRGGRRGQVESEPECWSDGDVEIGSSDYPSGSGRRSRTRRRSWSRNDSHGGRGGDGRGRADLSVRSTPGRRWASFDDRRDPSRRGWSGRWESEEYGSSSGNEEYRLYRGERRGGRRRPWNDSYRRRRSSEERSGSSAAPAAAAGASETAARERVQAAELLLVEERERMARDLEAERTKFREREVQREEERQREREADRARREELEMESMRRRLMEEENKAAAESRAARRRGSRADAERRRVQDNEEEEEQRQARQRDQERNGVQTVQGVAAKAAGAQSGQDVSFGGGHGHRVDGATGDDADGVRGGDLGGQERVLMEADAAAEVAVVAAATAPEASSLARPLPQGATRSSCATGVSMEELGTCREDGADNKQQQQQQQQTTGSGVLSPATNHDSRTPHGAVPSSKTDLEKTPKSPTLSSAPRDTPNEAPGRQIQAEKPGATQTRPDRTAASALGAKSGDAVAGSPDAQQVDITQASDGRDDPRVGGDGHVEPQAIDEADIAKAQAHREVQEYREKIRQRRQQQQQQHDQIPHSESTRVGVTTTAGDIPAVRATGGDAGEEDSPRASQRWQRSQSSGHHDGGDLGGSASDLSEPSTRSRGNLEVGGGQSSSDREDNEQDPPSAAVRNLSTRNTAGSSASVADGAGGGSGSGSGGFFGESVVSDGSDNDWF